MYDQTRNGALPSRSLLPPYPLLFNHEWLFALSKSQTHGYILAGFVLVVLFPANKIQTPLIMISSMNPEPEIVALAND